MDKQDFLENVKKQFVNADDITLTFETGFKSIDSYDSLTGMTIIVMIKDNYGIDLLDSEYKFQKTVEDLFNLVESKLNE